ncbi:peptidoglycan recognition protein family protein [Paenibacillus sp. FSL R7-0128]|uniref:peptidoglycan recognition protein family protein n=1 Tax=Paenibacillus sp. FSL R7-0128 TaxID=2954529 RepID=UPI0030F97CD7
MLTIKQQLIPVNRFSRPGKKLVAKRGIVMHYTADPGASAQAIGNYFISLKNQKSGDSTTNRYASAHIQIDRTTIVQSLPFDEMGYHCGSKQPYLTEALAKLGSYPNNSTVGIEMCIETDGAIHEDTFNNAVDLVVYLIQHEGFPEVIFTHKGVVGWKDCPLPWVKNPSEFERFKQRVHSRLETRDSIGQDNLQDSITFEEEEHLNLSVNQWTILINQLKELYNKKLITDYTWIDKAVAKKLTASELLFINTVIINRGIK